MALATAQYSAARRRWSRSGGRARTATPPSMEATVRRVRCSSDRRGGIALLVGVAGEKRRRRGPRAMETRSRVLAAIAVTLLAGCAWPLAPKTYAADIFVKAEEPVPVAAPWWYHYYVEV